MCYMTSCQPLVIVLQKVNKYVTIHVTRAIKTCYYVCDCSYKMVLQLYLVTHMMHVTTTKL